MVLSNSQFIFVLATLPWRNTSACTVVAAGRDASASGRPLVAHTDDGGAEPSDVRLVRVPGKTWDPSVDSRPLHVWSTHYPRFVGADRAPDYAPADESQLPSEPVGLIPQVAQTFAYWDMDYAVQNEHGLSMAESTCAARTAGWPVSLANGHCRAGIEDLSKIGMERCSTARCAVETMGRIAVEQGFYSADSGDPASPDYEDSSETLVIADEEDLWIFNVMTGANNASAIWAAQRVDPGHIVAVANTFTIRRIDLRDSRNFLFSPNVTALAQEMGWWTPADDDPGFFSWSRTYGFPFVEDGGTFNAGRRMWRVYSLLSGEELDPEKGEVPTTVDPYPASFPVQEGSITPQKIMSVLRDHYEGTPYDLTAGMAAGPFGTPNRASGAKGVTGSFERAISPEQSSFSFVSEASTQFFGSGVVWLGLATPHSTAYLPFFGIADRAPDSYSSDKVRQSKFSFEAAWWAFGLVNQFSDLNFRLINADVRESAAGLERNASRELAACHSRAQTSDQPAIDATRCLNNFVEGAVRHWWDYAWSLVAKYGRYSVTTNETAFEPQRYPEWWVRSRDVGFTTWHAGGPYHGEPCAVVATETNSSSSALFAEIATRANETTFSSGLVALMVSTAAVFASTLGYYAGTRRCRLVTVEPSSGYVHLAA